jgi:hypothetical protein
MANGFIAAKKSRFLAALGMTPSRANGGINPPLQERAVETPPLQGKARRAWVTTFRNKLRRSDRI